MPFYPFSCSECKVAWSVKAPMSKTPQRRRCPECGVYRPRLWTGKVPGLVFKGGGWFTNIARDEKLWKEGMDKDTAHEWYNSNIENTKDRISTGGQHYKTVRANHKWLEKHGQAKKLTDRQAKKRIKNAEKSARRAFDKAKLDPTKVSNPQD